MKTAMQDLWQMLDDAEQNGVFEVGTQNFKRYIEGIYLEKEKQQIIDFGNKMQLIRDVDFDGNAIFSFNPEDLYSETFKTKQ